MEDAHHGRALQGQDRGRVFAAGRVHPDLLIHPRAALQRARAGVLRQRRGPHRVHFGERRLRHERMGPHAECGNITMIPDGNGEFTGKMGLLVDKSELGFGKRSWRYSMLVRNGVIEKMFIEPEKPGDPFEVSDADTMLNYINPRAKKPDQVAIFTREGCGFCAKAKALLKSLGYAYSEVKLDHSDRARVVGAITGRGTVPQVFVNGRHVGGLEELQEWAKKAA